MHEKDSWQFDPLSEIDGANQALLPVQFGRGRILAALVYLGSAFSILAAAYSEPTLPTLTVEAPTDVCRNYPDLMRCYLVNANPRNTLPAKLP